MILLAGLTLLIWAYLLLFHGRFWSAGPVLPPVRPTVAPALDVVIPARDEAEGIEAAVRSLLRQDYPGPLRLILVDDGSTDGTGALARAIRDERLTVLDGAPRPAGWSGKLWAVSQGVAAGSAPLLLLTDADIVHEPGHLSALVAKMEAGPGNRVMPGPDPAIHAVPLPQAVAPLDSPAAAPGQRDRVDARIKSGHDVGGFDGGGYDLVSEMVELRCLSWAERALVPAFVFFFQLLYPFARVNDPRNGTAAAAGGTVLLRRAALERIGGIASLRGALIDDVTLASRIKPGGPIYLGHSALARSVRPYPGARDIWRMVARTAYVQLRFSPLLLLGTVLGLGLTWLAPPALALFGHGPARWMGAAAWAGSALSYVPTLLRFRQSPGWALLLPFIACFYLAATIGSAVDHHRGRGVVWKRRAYQDADA